MNRRRFMTGLAGIFAASAAPAFVPMGSLMVPRRVLAGETIESLIRWMPAVSVVRCRVGLASCAVQPWAADLDDTVPTLTIFRDGLKITEMRLRSGWNGTGVKVGEIVTVNHGIGLGLEPGRAYQYRVTDRQGGWVNLKPIA